jgi:hypothetical protein
MTYSIEIHDKERFALLYQSFVMGGNNTQDKKNIEVLRREIAIFDALDAVSTEANGARTMHDGPQVVTLDQPQYQLLKKYIDTMVSVAATSAARRMVELVDWFDAIKPGDDAKPSGKRKAG